MLAVDIFRGLCIVLMVLVNDPGDPERGYAQLRHVRWSGWTLADVVAPAFVWIVGLLVPLTMQRARERQQSAAAVQRRILARGAVLILLGFAINFGSSPDFFLHGAAWLDVGLLDILQRIGVSYVVVATAFLWFGMSGAIRVALACLGLYAVALGIGVQHFGLSGAFERPTNFAGRVDLWVLGPSLNAGQSLITLLTGIVTTVSGMACGFYFLNRPRELRTLVTPFAIGVSCLVAGLCMAAVIPINRYMWTPSFVLVTSGACTAFFCALLSLERSRAFASGAAPLASIGRNPIVLYALAALLTGWLSTAGFRAQDGWLSLWARAYRAFLTMHLPPEMASHAVTVLLLAGLWLIAWQMDRRRIYLRV
jgi:predicted acyltransferase